jgi:outer membrane protein assembly factor BamB
VKPILLAAAFITFLANTLIAADAPAGKDWPQFLGPTRNGVYAGGDLIDTLPASPKVLWKVDVGHGWSAPVVADGKVLIFHRVKDDAILDCLDAATGKQIWRTSYPTNYRDGFDFDPGPRATPAVADGRVFTFGAEGILRAVELATGKEIWKIDTAKQYRAQNGFFGLACSPVIAGKLLVVTIGGLQKTIIAVEVETGKEIWAGGGNTDLDNLGHKPEAGYASPTTAHIGDHDYLLAITRDALNVMKLSGGRLDVQFPFRSRQEASVNAATPIVVGNDVFISASYGVGGKLLRFDPAALATGRAKPQIIWENDDSLSCHYATPVVKDGMLYGFHGRQDQGPGPEFRCVEWATGKVRWSQEDFGAGTVTLAGDKVIVMSEKGVLRFVAATPNGFKEHGHAQILPATVRAYPAIAGGLLYARGQEQLVCIDLRKK